VSTSAVSDFAGPDSDRLRDALSRAAAALATDGRLAGPASAQDGLSDLVPSPDACGVSSALEDGTALVALLSPAAAAALGAPDAVTAALGSILGIAAAELGLALGDLIAFERADDLIVHLTEVHNALGDGRSVFGAGIFDGDAVVATVGAIVNAAAPATAFDSGPTTAPKPASSAPQAGGGAVFERGLQLLADIELTVTAELGRARMAVGELLDLQPGAIIELDREAGVPIDVLVNGTLFARGEVVVVEDSFAVRVSEIVTDEGSQ
jgi:flagellar motor switch protein FliN/FliY